MSNRYPLVINSELNRLEELSEGDNLDLGGSSILGISSITADFYYGYLDGTSKISESLSNAANILSGTISTQRLSGFYNIGVQTSLYLENAENIKSGIVSVTRLFGTYDISITGIAETANYLEDAGNINGGIISADRLSGVYNISISGSSLSTLGIEGEPDIQVGIVSSSSYITDAKGDVRTIPQIVAIDDYTLSKSDVGSHISIGSSQINIPENEFDVGDIVYVYNNFNGNLTLVQGNGTTVRSSGSPQSGNLTISSYTLLKILCVDVNEFVVSY